MIKEMYHQVIMQEEHQQVVLRIMVLVMITELEALLSVAVGVVKD